MKKAKKPPTKKAPVIRAGQTKPFVKATLEEQAERIELVEGLLGQGARTGQIKRALKTQYGLEHAQSMVYIGRARDNIRKRFGKNREAHRADSFAFYEAMATATSKATPIVKLRARQRIDELLGLDAPHRTELSGIEGQPIPVHVKTNDPIDFAEFQRVAGEMFGLSQPNGHPEPVHSPPTDRQAGDLPEPG